MYKRIHGHLRIPPSFKIPSAVDHAEEKREAADDWPEEHWGRHLGRQVRDIRQNQNFMREGIEGSAARRSALDERGFVWAYKEDRWENGLRAGLQTYYDAHGDLHVPVNHIVDGGGDTDKDTAGGGRLHIGSLVGRIRFMGETTYGSKFPLRKVRCFQYMMLTTSRVLAY